MSQEEMKEQQLFLGQDILYVNAQISELNIRFLRRSVRLDRNLLLCKQKLRGRNSNNENIKNIVYNNLYDGVHPTLQEVSKWYKFLCAAIKLDIQELSTSEIAVHDTWNFKRN